MDLAIDAPETPSTVIDPATETPASGAGAPRTLADPEAKQPSLRDTIAAEVKADDAERAKAEPKTDDKPKAEPEAKTEQSKEAKAEADSRPTPERGTDGKFAAKPKEGEAEPKADAQPADPVEKPEDAKHYPEPPKNFLPDSKEVYRNVPRAVRRDIDVMVREHEAFREQATKDTARYESIRPFDELARSNGRDLRESLVKINQVENAIKQDPIFGLNEILKEIGPRKADGSPLTIYEVASHIVEQGPQQYQQRMQQVQAAQPAPVDPRLAERDHQLAEANERLVELQIIAPFRENHPRYDELQDFIARVLQSDMISSSLSATERLEAAYVMAERLNPPSAQPVETDPAPAPTPRAADASAVSKSIKSAPGAVSHDMEPERGGEIRELLEDEFRRTKRSA